MKALVTYIVLVSGNELSLSFDPLKPLHTLHKEGGVYFYTQIKTATRRPPQGVCTGSVGLPQCRDHPSS